MLAAVRDTKKYETHMAQGPPLLLHHGSAKLPLDLMIGLGFANTTSWPPKKFRTIYLELAYLEPTILRTLYSSSYT